MIDGSPIAYWASDAVFQSFENMALQEIAEFKKGMSTGDNELYIKSWFEPSQERIGFGLSSAEYKTSGKRWFPINSGGGYRKWYGNNCYVVNWENDGQEIKDNATKLNNGGHWSRYVVNVDKFFLPGITWNGISSAAFSVRSFDRGFLFSSASMCCYTNMPLFVMALLNSSLTGLYLKFLAPTLNFGPEQIKKIPYVSSSSENIELLASENISLAKNDWDSFEESWDFRRHPLV